MEAVRERIGAKEGAQPPWSDACRGNRNRKSGGTGSKTFETQNFLPWEKAAAPICYGTGLGSKESAARCQTDKDPGGDEFRLPASDEGNAYKMMEAEASGSFPELIVHPDNTISVI